VTASLTCSQLTDFIDAYLEHSLSPEETAAFDAHLAQCPLCVAYLNSYKDAIAMGRRVLRDDDATLPESVPEDLVAAILATRPMA
jgi:anti-sigma factor RsiW